VIGWRLPYCLNVVDFIRPLILSSRKTPQNRRNSFYDKNTPDFIAADECASYFPDLNPLDYCFWDILQDLVYEGRRLPLANLQDLKEASKSK